MSDSDYDTRPKPKVWTGSPNECRTFSRMLCVMNVIYSRLYAVVFVRCLLPVQKTTTASVVDWLKLVLKNRNRSRSRTLKWSDTRLSWRRSWDRASLAKSGLVWSKQIYFRFYHLSCRYVLFATLVKVTRKWTSLKFLEAIVQWRNDKRVIIWPTLLICCLLHI